MTEKEKAGLPELEKRPGIQLDFLKDAHDGYAERYLFILDAYKVYIERSLTQKHKLNTHANNGTTINETIQIAHFLNK